MMYLSFKENISNNEPKTKEIDLVKEKIIYPKYNIECKIHKRKTRRVTGMFNSLLNICRTIFL